MNRNNIKNIHFISWIETGFGNWVSHDRFKYEDLGWLKKKYVYKDRLYDESCDIDVYFFEKPSKTILDQLQLFKDGSLVDYSEKLYDFLQRLEKNKVVIRQYCTC